MYCLYQYVEPQIGRPAGPVASAELQADLMIGTLRNAPERPGTPRNALPGFGAPNRPAGRPGRFAARNRATKSAELHAELAIGTLRNAPGRSGTPRPELEPQIDCSLGGNRLWSPQNADPQTAILRLPEAQPTFPLRNMSRQAGAEGGPLPLHFRVLLVPVFRAPNRPAGPPGRFAARNRATKSAELQRDRDAPERSGALRNALAKVGAPN